MPEAANGPSEVAKTREDVIKAMPTVSSPVSAFVEAEMTEEDAMAMGV